MTGSPVHVPYSQYSLEHGSYYLRSGPSKNISFMCDQVAMAYWGKEDGGGLFKHGDPKSVREIAKKNGLNFLKLPRGFPVDVINHCLACHNVLALLDRIEKGEFDHLGQSYDALD